MTRSQKKGFSNTSIVVLVVAVLTLTLMATYGSQYIFDEKINPDSNELKDQKTEYEISKLDAEISRIRSETAGSLFSLKLIALFVTVGGAIGGYLVGQSRNTLARINFEDIKSGSCSQARLNSQVFSIRVECQRCQKRSAFPVNKTSPCRSAVY
jgi:hypothetical protein